MRRVLLTLAVMLTLTAGCSSTLAPPAPTAQSAPNPTLNSVVTLAPAPAPAPPVLTPPEPQQARRTLTGMQQVTRVFDGDTLFARLAGDDVGVRFIGINAPEVKHPNHPQDDCLGPEARQRARDLLAGGVATLTFDRTQGDRDKYGRFLRYVNTAPASLDVALVLIKEGLAKEYTYNKPYKRQELYREAEAGARAALRGGWTTCHWS